MIKIIIIDDHPVVLFNLQLVLQAQQAFEVVGTYATGHSLLEVADLNHVDVALLDINLPDMDGFEICAHLHSAYPHIKIIGISSFEDSEYITRLLNLGAHGYVVKGTTNKELVKAIHEVSLGQTFLCEVARNALNQNTSNYNSTIKLTQREKKLMELTNKHNSFVEVSAHLDENIEDTQLYLKLLIDKIEFYRLPYQIKQPTE